MTDNDWKEIWSAFDIFDTIADTEKQQFLNKLAIQKPQVYASILELIEQHTDTLDIVKYNNIRSNSTKETNLSGQNIGAYHLLHILGQGGSSIVYLAKRLEPFEQKVALKILHTNSNPYAKRRFAQERHLLAQLQHPTIAQIMDGGESDAHGSYLVTEYIEGMSITDFVQKHQSSLTERLDLFLIACKGIQFVHTKLILHRDLKPSHLIITEDKQVKIIDFGISQLIQSKDIEHLSDLNTEKQLMTLAYASPEQVASKPMDLSSDVFSMGIILFQLLTGVHPFMSEQTVPFRLKQNILHNPPTSLLSIIEKQPHLSYLNKSAHQDLWIIVHKALEKNPNDRYSTIQKFFDEIQRYMQTKPIESRKKNFSYFASCFIRRNQYAVIAGFFILSLLIGGLIVTNHQRNLAEIASMRSEKLTRVMESLISSYDTYNATEQNNQWIDSTNVQLLVARGLNSIKKDLKGEPELQYRIYRNLTKMLIGRAEYEQVKTLLTPIIEQDKDKETAKSVDFLIMEFHLGTSLYHLDQQKEAMELLKLNWLQVMFY